MTKAGKRTYGKTLASAKAIADAEARAVFLETELEHVDKPAKLVGPLVEALAATLDSDALSAKLVAIAQAHPRRVAVLDSLGAELVTRSEVDDARVVLELATDAGSRNVESHYWLGRILLLRREPAAVRAMERVLELDPNNVKARIYLASWFVDRAPERALDLLETVDLGYASELRAMAHERAGRAGDADRELENAIIELGGSLEARCALASWHCSEHRYARGLVHGRELFSMRNGRSDDQVPNLDKVDLTIVRAYRHGGVLAELLPWLRARTAGISPELGAQLYAGLDDLDPQLAIRGGEAMLAQAREKGDAREVRLWRVRVARIRAKAGEEGVLEALAHDGLDDDPVAWIELANGYRGQKHYDAAHAAVDRALELDPHSGEALVALFGLALHTGDAGALERTARALPKVKPLWHQSPEHLARMLARNCDRAAVKHAKRAADIAPWCHNAWLALGEAQLVAGDLDAAREALVRVEQIDPAEPGDDTTILKAALARDPDGLERALAERYKHLAALPFPAFVAALREVARAPAMP